MSTKEVKTRSLIEFVNKTSNVPVCNIIHNSFSEHKTLNYTPWTKAGHCAEIDRDEILLKKKNPITISCFKAHFINFQLHRERSLVRS